MTMGDHVYRKDEIYQIFDRTADVLRPANFPADSPGPELALRQGPRRHPGRRVHRAGPDLHEAGRLTRSAPPTACSSQIGADTRVILVDVHAEATSDKQLLGRYLDGRVSAVLGTHTHVATADEQILKNGTAYQTDVGMTGPHDSIIGRRYDRVLVGDPDLRPHLLRRRHRRPPPERGARDDRSPDRPRAGDQPGQHRPGGSPAPADGLLDERGPPGGLRQRPAGMVQTHSPLTLATLVVKL